MLSAKYAKISIPRIIADSQYSNLSVFYLMALPRLYGSVTVYYDINIFVPVDTHVTMLIFIL
jgi:hypothetical protein